jgi:hypothetical protein
MTMSKLFREGFRRYSARQARLVLEEIGEYAATRKSSYTEADVMRLIKKVRRAKPIRVTRTSR